MKDQSERVAIPAVNWYTIQVKVKEVRKSNQQEKWCEEAKVANAQKVELMHGKKQKVRKAENWKGLNYAKETYQKKRGKVKSKNVTKVVAEIFVGKSGSNACDKRK